MWEQEARVSVAAGWGAKQQAGRQGGRHAKANKQHWTRTSKARGEEATKGSGGRRGSKGLGTNGVGKKRVTCAPGHPYYSIPCLPACLPALLLSIDVLLKSPLFVSGLKKKKINLSSYFPPPLLHHHNLVN